MRDKGELVKRGSISDGGDVEFWDNERATKKEGEEKQPLEDI